MSAEGAAPEVAENGTKPAEDYETVQLEAYDVEAASKNDADAEDAVESWTTYEISKESEVKPPAVSQSPAVSEITPEVEETEKPEFMVSSAPVQISVSNPKKAEEVSKLGIRTTFTSYFVQSETNLTDYPFTKRAVWRRYRDFDMLHRLLRENHRGYIIPPLPSKNYLEAKRGKDSFIRERQIELNKFLCQVALHPELYKTEELKIFLGCPSELTASHDWYQLIEQGKQLTGGSDAGPTDLENPVENIRRDMASMFKKVGNSFKREVLNRSYTISETEKNLQDMVPRLKQFELTLSGSVDKAQSFLLLFEGVGNELGLLGRVWLTISRFEEGFVETFGQYSDMGRAIVDTIAALHKSGYAAVRVQQITGKSLTLLKARLGVLTDHFNMLPSILCSLQDRTLVLRHLYDAQNQLEASRRALDALTRDSTKKLGGTAGFSNKSAVLSQEIRSWVDEVSKRTELYDVVTKRNLNELDRQNNKRSQDLCEMALCVAKMQQEFYETISLVWVNLAEEISRMSEAETPESKQPET